MSDWMAVRVVLESGSGTVLARPAGRVLLAHSDHTFAELAEAIDIAFGRWDLTPAHSFDVEGRRLTSAELVVAGIDALDVEDSEDVTIGEAGLRLGERFRYEFDPGEHWQHECTVEEVEVDPFELHGHEPEQPVAIFGWGSLPDQYGRLGPDDEDDEDEPQGRSGPGITSWAVVSEALAGVDQPEAPDELAAAAARIRSGAPAGEWPFGVLVAAGGLDPHVLPGDDRELWIRLAAGVVSPREPLPIEPEDEAGWAALEPADWAGAVIELVRAGVGQPADAEALLDLIGRCPEVEVSDWSEEDEELLADGLDTVAQLWEALGALDAQQRLTALGRWGLPEGLRLAWTGT